MNRIFSTIALLIFVSSCKSIYMKGASDFYMQDDSVNLNAFIGQKISVTQFNPNINNRKTVFDPESGDSVTHVTLITDNAFKLRYRVIRNVFNQLRTDTVDFIAYDHYGKPGLDQYDYALLYISKDETGGYCLQKYQYDVLKKSRHGKWMGLHRESIEHLFNERKNDVLKSRGVFK